VASRAEKLGAVEHDGAAAGVALLTRGAGQRSDIFREQRRFMELVSGLAIEARQQSLVLPVGP
jgi:hypothetical protein